MDYGITINSRFKPFSFERYIQPYQIYGQAYKEQEDILNALETEAAQWEQRINPAIDEDVAVQYKRYADDLRAQADLLATQGLSPSSRRSIQGMRRRYASEITPIEQAYKTRMAQAEQQQAALLKDPSLLISRRADTTSLRDYMNNPSLGYEVESGNALTERGRQAAAAIAQELRDYGRGKPLDGFTRTFIQEYGLSAGDVAFAINHPDDPRASTILNTIVDNIIAGSSVSQWGDDATLNKAKQRVREGLWKAVGKDQISTYTDQAAQMAAQEAMQLRAYERAQRAAEQQKRVLSLTPNFDRRNVKTTKEIGDIAQDAKDWDALKQYFQKNAKGQWELTAKGRRQALVNPYGSSSVTGATQQYSTDTNFGKFIKKHNLMGMFQGRPGPSQTAVIDKMLDRIANTYDTTAATEYVRRIHPSDYKNIISILNSSATEGNVYNYNRIKNNNSYEWSRGDEVKVSELKESDIKSANTVYGKHGNFLEIKLTDGTTLNVPVTSYSPNYSNLMQGNASNIEGYRAMLADGKTHYQLPTGEILPIESLINLELNAYGDNFMSSLAHSQINPIKTDRGEYTIQVQ